MIIKVINSEAFCKNIGWGKTEVFIDKEFEVLAIRDYISNNIWELSKRNKKEYLILIKIAEIVHFAWCINDNAIDIINSKKDINWILTPKFTYSSKDDLQKIKFTNVESPKWMIENESFFYNIYENHKKALDIYNTNFAI